MMSTNRLYDVVYKCRECGFHGRSNKVYEQQRIYIGNLPRQRASGRIEYYCPNCNTYWGDEKLEPVPWEELYPELRAHLAEINTQPIV
jgi:predicted RNA-binding Zn-ribbon protein involved in translation (DUF1610 family)